MPYATREDVEIIFGSLNVEKWADLDSTEDNDVIDDRIDAALDWSTAYIDSKLRGSAYAIPFTGTAPKLIRYACAQYAGWLLYVGRGIPDGADANDAMEKHKDLVDETLQHIAMNRTILDAPKVGTGAPAVVNA